ncbi:hypothetical protein LMG28138_06118 [Pararobbsia alpina]|uniref:Uncharacterized protein n=1 Tax=Pararobbsia alpina TaxID=621374 RepID=A0A6S7DIY7_9BURK|nr:hypothetical protein LMG28138_06118 [Pararobbsia alpina]
MGIEPAQARVRIRDDGSERLIDFMGDRRGHFSDHQDPVQSRESGLCLLQRILHPLAFADVVVRLQDQRGLSCMVVLKRPTARYDDRRAVHLAVDELAFPAAFAQQLGHDLLDRRDERRLQERVRDSAERLRALESIQLLGAAIPVENFAVHVAREDGVVRQVEETRLIAERRNRLLRMQGQGRHEADRSDADALVD